MVEPVSEIGAEPDRVSGQRDRSMVTETSSNTRSIGALGL
jgi:hypothetical protein